MAEAQAADEAAHSPGRKLAQSTEDKANKQTPQAAEDGLQPQVDATTSEPTEDELTREPATLQNENGGSWTAYYLIIALAAFAVIGYFFLLPSTTSSDDE